jgi:protein-disulfide isomerase
MSRKTIFISVAGILLLAFVMATLVYRNYQSLLPGVGGASSQGIAERQGAPVKGPADARVTIVEFFDPACETCADFYPLVKQLMDRYPGKVRVMLRYAPLHPGSDQVVKMLEAAHLQGKFFPALELLFGNQRRWVVDHTSQPDRALGILKGMALDHDRLQADMNGPAVNQAIAQDVQAGQALGVRATPEFFVNGRPIPEWGYEQLERLVEQAVKDSY